MSAVTLSYIKESEQALVIECIEQNGFTVNIKKADEMRRLSEAGKLNKDSIYLILCGKTNPKTTRLPTFKLKKGVYEKYFKPGQSAKEIQEIMEKALAMYFSRQ